MPLFRVEYHIATYSGTRTVGAESPHEAEQKVKAWARKQMVIPMYTDGYEATEIVDEDKNSRNDY